MADQKRWFKVWTSILLDPAMNTMDLADVGRWVRLGALAAAVGDHGRLTFPASGEGLIQTLRSSTLEDAKRAISRLPHVDVEEGKTDYGEFAVTFRNWTKYQEDSTQSERQRRSRSKRRGEEIRGDKKRNPPVVPPTEVRPIPASILEALNRAPLLGAVSRLRRPEFWQAVIRATNGHVEYAAELLKAEAWLTANPSRSPHKDLSRFLHNWLNRAGDRI